MKYYQSPRWSGEFLDCSMPMTFDTYSVCSYNCLYCFSFFQRGTREGDYLSRNVKWISVDRVKKMFLEPDNSQFGNYIKKRYTMQWGGLSDQFDEYERKHGVTLELMKFFREIKYPISFSTKATWFLEDDRYTDLIKGADNWHFKVSIITNDREKARKVERGVPSPEDRLAALTKLKDLGVAGVTLRFRPFIIGISNPGHKQLISDAADAGADSVSTEFLCLESRAADRGKSRYQGISDAAGFDIFQKYKDYSSGSGYLRLNRKSKEKFIDDMEEACNQKGLRFYVSDAHFKERSHHGSCCGIPEHMDYNRGQYTEALVKAKKCGEVCFSDISEPAKELFGKLEAGKAVGYNTNTTENRARIAGWTFYDMMRYHWNKPKTAKSPYKYFGGVLVPLRVDENGDVVYGYKGK